VVNFYRKSWLTRRWEWIVGRLERLRYPAVEVSIVVFFGFLIAISVFLTITMLRTLR